MSCVNLDWKHKFTWNKSVWIVLQIQEYCIFLWCIFPPFVFLYFEHITPVVFPGFVAVKLHFSEFDGINLTAKIHLVGVVAGY